MKIESVTPMLRTWDLEATVAFYNEVLGFDCEGLEPEWGWATISCGGFQVMFAGPNEHEGDVEPAFTGSIYFRVSDVDDMWSMVEGRVQVCYPPEDFDYGMREFAIYDNNGYLLQFGQAL